MNLSSRLPAVVLFVTLSGSLLGTPPGEAQVLVNDPPHTIQTILHYVGRLTEIAQKYVVIYNQYEQLASQYRQIAYQLQALKKLDFHNARSIGQAIGQMERILGWGDDLPSHMNPYVEELHRELFPGWELARDFWQEEEEAVTASLDTLRATLRAQHEAHRTSADHLSTLGAIKQQIHDAEGTEQVLEALAGLAAYHAEASTLAELSEATSADAATAYFSHELNLFARQLHSIQAALEAEDLVPPTLVPGDGWKALPSWWH